MTKNSRSPTREAFNPQAQLSVTIDVARYQALLDDEDLSEAQKRAFLETLWSLIVDFVELGFGIHPTQIACGQLAQPGKNRPALAFDTVNSVQPDGGTAPIKDSPGTD